MMRTILSLALLSTISGCSVLFGETPTAKDRDSGGIVDADLVNDAADTRTLGPLLNLSSGANDSVQATALWDGSTFRVVWQEREDDQSNIVGVTIAEDAPSAPASFIVGAAQDSRITATWSGDKLAAAWLSGEAVSPTLRHALFDTNFDLELMLDLSSGGVDEGAPREPCILRAPTQIAVGWTQVNGTTATLALSRLGIDGTLVATSAVAESGLQPSVAYSGSSYALAWRNVGDAFGGNEFSSILVERINASGVVISAPVAVSHAGINAITPTIVGGDNELAVIWQEVNGDSEETILFARIMSDSVVSDPVVLSGDSDSATAPTLIWNGEGYGAAWQERRDGRVEVVFQELDANGEKLGPNVQLSEGESNAAGISLVHNGMNYAAAWNKGPTGARLIQFRTF